MASDLFHSIIEARPSTRASRLSALPATLFLHVIVLVVAVVIPLLATDALPSVSNNSTLVLTPVRLATPPQPSPSRRRPTLPVEPISVPLQSPNGIGSERLAPSPPSEIFATPEDMVPGLLDGPGIDAVTPGPPPPSTPNAPLRISALTGPVRVFDVAPAYPELARVSRVEGVVIIEAVIGTTGNVTEARILRSIPLLDEAAVAAVRQWRYTPTLLSGVPVPVIMTVTVTFKLQ
jgi:protein TonB